MKFARGTRIMIKQQSLARSADICTICCNWVFISNHLAQPSDVSRSKSLTEIAQPFQCRSPVLRSFYALRHRFTLPASATPTTATQPRARPRRTDERFVTNNLGKRIIRMDGTNLSSADTQHVV